MTVSAATYRARQSEKAFQADVVKAAEALGWYCVHFPNAICNPTWVDLTLFKGRRALLIELKTDHGRLGPRQAELLADLAAIGAEAYVIRPSEWAFLESLLRGEG